MTLSMPPDEGAHQRSDLLQLVGGGGTRISIILVAMAYAGMRTRSGRRRTKWLSAPRPLAAPLTDADTHRVTRRLVQPVATMEIQPQLHLPSTDLGPLGAAAVLIPETSDLGGHLGQPEQFPQTPGPRGYMWGAPHKKRSGPEGKPCQTAGHAKSERRARCASPASIHR